MNADRGGTAIGRVESIGRVEYRVEYQRPEVVGQPVRLMPRPVFLAGREELLAGLDARLSAGNGEGPRVVALYGLGGAGKTTVALEYAHRHLAGLGVVWQFQAEEPTVLAAGFGDLAAQLGARVLLDVGDPVAQVHAVLAARPGSWLLIFDNAPGPAALQRMLPPAGHGQVLITSQNPHWPGQAVEVPVLGLGVAAAFLLARTGLADQGAAGELAAELGGLPLALEQASAYMQSAGRSIGGYLDLFLQRRTDLLARGEIAGYDKQVATTWALAFAELDQVGPAAGLLRFTACCAAEDIPLYLLLRPGLDADFGAEVAPLLMPLLEDDLARDEAVAGLRRYSLISEPHDGLVSVHRLVQAITLDEMPADLAAAWRQATAAVIEAALPEDPEDPATWPAMAALLPHAQAALTPANYGMVKIVTYLRAIGTNSAAFVLQRQILDACKADLGAEHSRTLTARASMATLTGEAGDPAAARDQFAELVPVMKRILGEEHPATLTTRSNLARRTGMAGNPAAARDQYAAELLVRERVLGEEHPATLTTRSNLARWTGEAGDPAAARDQYAGLLPVLERVLGSGHHNTLTARRNLAHWTRQAEISGKTLGGD